MLLLNPYGVDMGTNGLIIQAQSLEEIYADKLLAFALRPNRIKNRDLWDIIWLHQQKLKPHLNLIPNKLKDRNISSESFLSLFEERRKLIETEKNMQIDFQNELSRFFSEQQINTIIKQEKLWSFIIYLMKDLGRQLINTLETTS